MLQCLFIAYDADRRRSTCLYADHYRFISEEAMTVTSELLETER